MKLLFAILPLFLSAAHAETVAARRVTIQKSKITLKAALDSVRQQTGINVQAAEGLAGTELSLDVTKQSLWEVLDLIAAKVKGRLYLYGSEGSLQIVPRTSSADLRVSYSGPFRITMQRITATRNLETGTRELRLVMEIAWEPGFQPLFLSSNPRELVCQDEKGRPWGTVTGGSNWIDIDGRRAASVEVSLSVPSDKKAKTPTALGLVKGHFLIRGSPEMTTFDFGRLSRIEKDKPPLTESQGDTICSLRSWKFDEDLWSFEIYSAIPKTGPVLESHQFWYVNNRLLLKGKKETFKPTGVGDQRSSRSRSALITYYFSPPPRGIKPGDLSLQYRMPLRVVEVPIPFSFKDLPMP